MEEVSIGVPTAATPLNTVMGKPLKDLTHDENKRYQNLRAIKSRTAKKQREKAASYKFGSTADVPKSEGLEILAARITNPHVREVCYQLAIEAADANQLPFNRFLLAHGLQKTLASKAARTEVHLENDPTPAVRSEIILTGDLHAIWDYSVSWREDVSFEDFVETRKKLKSDWFALSPFIDGREFSEKPHRIWQQFLPIFDPCLPPNYTQAQENAWLKQQKSATGPVETRDYGRFSIAWADDVISNINSQVEEQRAKVIETYDALLKLREVGSSIVITVGTAWYIGDLYFELQRRNADDPQKSLAVLVQPAWTVKPGRQRPIPLLQESDVDLAFPDRLTFKFLMKEARTNLPLFRSQNLLEYSDEDDDIRCTFTLEQLNAAVRPTNAFALATKIWRVLSVDQAHSTSRYADYSCLIILDILKNLNERTNQPENIAFVKDVRLERMKTSDLAVAICDFVHEHKPDRCVIERSGDWQSLQDALVRAFMLRGRIMPQVYWKPTTHAQGANMLAKTARIKSSVEPLLHEDKLFFSAGIPILDECFQQTIKFDGIHRSGSTRKDDFVDALAIGLITFYPTTAAPEQIDPALTEFEERARIQATLAGQHERLFGSPSLVPQYQPENLEPAALHALYDTLGRYGMSRRAA